MGSAAAPWLLDIPTVPNSCGTPDHRQVAALHAGMAEGGSYVSQHLCRLQLQALQCTATVASLETQGETAISIIAVL